MSRGFLRTLRKAITEDVIGYFMPLSNTARVLLGRIGLSRVSERSFLRLKLHELQAAYRNEVSWMELPSGNGVRVIPLIAVADWTRDPATSLLGDHPARCRQRFDRNQALHWT